MSARLMPAGQLRAKHAGRNKRSALRLPGFRQIDHRDKTSQRRSIVARMSAAICGVDSGGTQTLAGPIMTTRLRPMRSGTAPAESHVR